jgi:integrase
MSDVVTIASSDLPEGVYLRGARWWISYYGPVGGDGQMKQIREPAIRPDGKPVHTPKEAEKVRRARLEEVAMHRRGVLQFQGPRAERLSFNDLLDHYERQAEVLGLASLPQIKSRVKRLKSYFAGYRALTVTHDVLLRFVQYRQADDAANATINRELEVVGRAFALALTAGKLAFAPKVPTLREDNARQGFFDRAEYECVLSYIDDADIVDFLEWFFRTGMRPKEIRSLTWAAYDRETLRLTLPAKDAKTRKPRTVPLHAELREIVERRLKVRRVEGRDGSEFLAEYIFHRGGERLGEFRKTWLTACRKAGLAVAHERDGKTVYQALRRPYDLRRTACATWCAAGPTPRWR